jgi:hypothetical protein
MNAILFSQILGMKSDKFFNGAHNGEISGPVYLPVTRSLLCVEGNLNGKKEESPGESTIS